MMREKTIEKIIKGFISKSLMVDPNDITCETNLVNDLNADSMDVVNLVTAIESKFKIVFPNASVLKHDGCTVQVLIDGVVSALKEKPTTSRRRTKSSTE